MSPFNESYQTSQQARTTLRLTCGKHIDRQRKGKERVEPGLYGARGPKCCCSLEFKHIV